MAELIGLAASLAGLVTFAAQITRLSYDIFTDISEASRTQQQYLQEVFALTDVLFRSRNAALQAEDLKLNPDTTRPTSLSNALLADCQSELSSICNDLTAGIKRSKWLFKERELRRNIDQMQRYHGIFSDYISAHTLTTSTATYVKVNSLSSEIDDISKEMKRKELLDWVNMSEDTSKPMPTPTPDTGKWFLETAQYQEWRDGDPSLLWCSGAPGAGKSVISSLVVKALGSANKSGCTTYYFCDYGSRMRQTTISILKSLVSRLVPRLDTNTIMGLVKYKEGSKQEPDVDLLCEMVAIASKYQQIMIVFDALDELDKIPDFLKILRGFLTARCRVFVTSRERELQYPKSDSPPTIGVTISASPADIRMFLESRFGEEGHENILNRGQDLFDTIIEKADGRFLFARILAARLLELVTLAQMRKALKSMPSTIDEFFESDLLRIQSQPKPKRDLALRLIAWVVQSKRRLKVNELMHALAIEEDDEFDEDNVPVPSLVLRACVGLVVEEAFDKSIAMVHTTAYEFFENRGLEFTQAHIAASCLNYLTSSPLAFGPCWESPEMEERLQQRPFLLYAAKFWGEHISTPEIEDELLTLVEKLFENHLLRTASFQALHYRRDLPEPLATELLRSIPTDQSALHLAAYWNLRKATGMLLQNGGDISARDSQGWTPLHWACKTASGGRSILDLLVKAGSDVNARDSQGWTPLFQLVLNENLDGIKLLVSYGASHLVRDSHKWSPLIWAVSANKKLAVKVLLEHHERWLEMQKNPPRALVRDLTYTQACDFCDMYRMDDDAMQLVLKNGSDSILTLFDSQKSLDSVALWPLHHFDLPVSNVWRTMDKAEKVNGVESYLGDRYRSLFHRPENGPKVEERVWKSRLLHRAIKDDNYPAAQILLNLNADANFSIGRTPLHAAAFREDPRYTKLLLTHGADISMRDKYGQTPLHQAVVNGFVNTASELIKWGSSVDERVIWPTGKGTRFSSRYSDDRPSNGTTPLLMACGFRQDRTNNMDESSTVQARMLDLLLANNADCNIGDLEGKTPLHHVVENQYRDSVETLLAAGADVLLCDNEDRNVLHFAARRADFELLQKLVVAGAPIHAVDKLNMHVIHHLANSEFNAGLSTDELRRILTLLQADTSYYYNLEWVATIQWGRGEIDEHYTTSSSTGEINKHYTSSSTGASDDLPQVTRNPMSLCLRSQNWTFFGLLLEEGALLPPGFDTQPFLERTVCQMRYAAVKGLLKLGATLEDNFIPEWVGWWRESWLGWSHCIRANPKMPKDFLVKFLQLLAENGCDVRQNTNGSTAAVLLQLASSIDSPAINQSLLEWFSGPRGIDPCGWDACALSALHGNYANLACFLKYLGASLPDTTTSASDDIEGIYVLQQYCNLLKSRGTIDDLVTPASENEDAVNLLWISTYKHNKTLVSQLLMHGSDPNTMNGAGWRPIHLASYRGDEIVVDALIRAGADIHARVLWWDERASGYERPPGMNGMPWRGTALHLAAMKGFPKVVKLLLRHGADVNSQVESGGRGSGIFRQHYTVEIPSHGPSALHLALVTPEIYFNGRYAEPLGEDRLHLVEILLENGADVATAANHIKLDHVLRFKDNQSLWESLRAGISESGQSVFGEDRLSPMHGRIQA